MIVLVTGANGLVGRVLTRRLLAGDTILGHVDRLICCDFLLPALPRTEQVVTIEGDLLNDAVRSRVLSQQADIVFHLAALDGATAERDPAGSKANNLNLSLDLWEGIAAWSNVPRVVFTSTIAVHNVTGLEMVEDRQVPAPRNTFAAHKLMAEIGLADFTRRGLLDGLSLRFATILARLPEPAGVNNVWSQTSFQSDLFWPFVDGRPRTLPLSPDTPLTFMSTKHFVDNLLHAGSVSKSLLSEQSAFTVPMLTPTISSLVDAMAALTGKSKNLITFKTVAEVERRVRSFPRIGGAAATAAGFSHESDVNTLTANVLEELNLTEWQ